MRTSWQTGTASRLYPPRTRRDAGFGFRNWTGEMTILPNLKVSRSSIKNVDCGGSWTMFEPLL